MDEKPGEPVTVITRSDSPVTQPRPHSVVDSDSTTTKRRLVLKRSQAYKGAFPVSCDTVLIHSFALTYFVCILISLGYILERRRYLSLHPPTQECQRNESLSTVEAQFDIDLAALDELTFTQAKLMDLAWDIGVGHGGRLLHGWIFYHVACRTVTSILEYSALPYWLLIEILFRPDSLAALHALFKSLNRTYRSTALFNILLLVLGVGHVLFFSTLWSAATGYKSPVQDGYSMPDKSWVIRTSESLRICWNVDYKRLPGIGLESGVILGPKFGSLFSSFEELNPVDMTEFQSGNGLWGNLGRVSVSEDFRNIYAYARTKYTFDRFMDAYNRKVSNIKSTNATGNDIVWDSKLPYYGELGPKGFNSVPFDIDGTKAEGPPLTIQGWQFLGEGEEKAKSANEMVWLSQEWWDPWSSPEPKTGSRHLRSTFQLNASLSADALVTAYNSTLWFRGASAHIQAPFLELGKTCANAFFPSLLGECLCYKGEPLTEDFRAGKFCTSGVDRNQYIWGFSLSLTLIGTILEAVWILISFYLWISSNQMSKLIGSGRSTTGDVRNILDLSGAITSELKRTTGWETDKELRRELSKRRPVGFAMTDGSGLGGDIGLVAIPEGQVTRRRLKLDRLRQVD
ncbi:hypothetical protein QBC34DRAFT_440071 [Podospora aff. communis PSN243]|uniref:Uncharacterized protein n=1 Tax=Podospora aff. communis PSN243 TaxID=3040156 RepID=A0AAV9GHB9_9PEZI|nr:hypothetical protein QBC34DRAFT_440071 [Podospora aff. communis PSN243]